MARVPEALLERLVPLRQQHELPTQLRPLARNFARQVLGVLFPHLAERVAASRPGTIEDVIELQDALARLERAVATLKVTMPEGTIERFIDNLAPIHDLLREDAAAIAQSDPAASGIDEVILTYPGFYALAIHRVAHSLFELRVPLLPRLLSEFAHEKTGIDIHPGATLGRRFSIDHGTGVVIGETAHIGENVRIFQGVTLGALAVEKQLAGNKRHPTIEDGVVIYAGATILGGKTVIGRDSIVAGNAWLTQSVPPSSIVNSRNDVRPRGRVGANEVEWVI